MVEPTPWCNRGVHEQHASAITPWCNRAVHVHRAYAIVAGGAGAYSCPLSRGVLLVRLCVCGVLALCVFCVLQCMRVCVMCVMCGR